MEENSLLKNISTYKRKYYLNLCLRGTIVSFGLLLSAFLFYNLLEYFAHFSTLIRSILFYSYLLLLTFVFFKWIVLPLTAVFLESLQITNEEAARHIGKYFPLISDKLLNILQLQKLDPEKNRLVKAGIDQKSSEINHIHFNHAISFSTNKKYLVYLTVPFIITLFLGLTFPKILQDSTTRIVNYRKEYKPVAPFQFVLENERLLAFKNEDFVVNLKLTGDMIPENIYLDLDERKIKLNSGDPSSYSYTFNKLAKNTSFRFEAAGFSSKEYTIEVVNRPNIKNFNVSLSYPAYLHMQPERFSNTGNLQLPEGTRVSWQYQTIFTDSMYFNFRSDNTLYDLQRSDNQMFNFDKQILKSTDYEILMKNKYATGKDKIIYRLDVVPDEYPKISVNQYADTVLYEFLILGGNISDDHGFRDLNLYYTILHGPKNAVNQQYESREITIDPSKNSQGYYFHWNLDSLKLNQSDQIEYYLQVRDNDGINGSKASRTGLYHFRIPGKKELNEEMAKSSQATEYQIDKSYQKARELNDKLNEIEDRLKGKKQMSWQDQKLIEELIQQKKQLDDELEKLKELNKASEQKRDRFSEQDKEIKEKVKQLQKLMDDLLDEKTKKLYEELSKLLEEKKGLNEIKNQLENINLNEKDLAKNIERALELFKRLKFEKQLDDIINNLQNLGEQQEDLSKETQDQTKDLDNIGNQQEEMNKDFKDIQKSYEEMLDLNQELKFPHRIPDTFEEEKQIQKDQQNALENLKSGKRKPASGSQQNAGQNMKMLAQKMQSMQSSTQMMEMQMNLKALREIIDDLLKLSFTQEDIMNGFKKVNQSDPRFIELSQKQLKLKDDARVIEDSLQSLSKRLLMISSFVTRELSAMNNHMDASMSALRERNKSEAIGKQQFAMTSMNNLALLLDDVFSMLQQAMMSMGQGQQQQNQNNQSLSKLQQQLNNEISELKKSGVQGRKLSEELARLAAEQERIRRMLQEQDKKQDQIGNDGKEGSPGDLVNEMEKSESDLVNKRLTEQLIQRQQEIMTRLLEAEKATREQELDKDREAKTAKPVERTVPPEFKEYLKAKEKEIELLRTLPPKLNPYYKKEVMEYFNRLDTLK